MKKLLILAAALAGVGAANAQDPVKGVSWNTELTPVTELKDGGTYLMYDASKILTGESANCKAWRKVTTGDIVIKGTSDPTMSAGAITYSEAAFQAIKDGDNWQFKHLGTGMYIPVVNGEVKPLSLAIDHGEGTWIATLNEANSAFKVKSSRQNQYWDGLNNEGTNGYKMCTWGAPNDNSTHWYQFFDLENEAFSVDNVVTVTAQITHDGQVVRERTMQGCVGEPYAVTVLGYDFSGTFSETTTLTKELACPTLTTDASNPAYLLIKNLRSDRSASGHSERNGVLTAVAPGTSGQLQLKMDDELNATESSYHVGSLWYMVAAGNVDLNGFIPVRIYNALTGKALSDPSNGTWANDDDAATIWNVVANSNGNYSGYSIVHNKNLNDNGSAWNDAGGNGATIAYWKANDAGSIWDFEEPDADKVTATLAAIEELMAAEDIETFNAVKANGDAFAALGVATDEAIAAWNTAAATTDKKTVKVINRLKEAYEALVSSSANMAGGAHVMFKHSQRDAAYMSVVNGAIRRDAVEGTHVFTLEAVEGGFKIFNEHANGYIKHQSVIYKPELFVKNAEDASVFVFDLYDANTGLCGIKAIDATQRVYIHANAEDQDVTNVVAWDKGTASSWYVELATAEQAASEHLAGAKAYFEGLAIGPGFGEYNISDADQAAADAAMATADDAGVEEKRAAAQVLFGIELHMNMPLAGRFYRLQGVEGNAGKFLSSTLSGGKLSIADANEADGTNTDNSLATVFYFDGTHLIDMATGMALANGNAHNLVLTADSNAGTITFVAAPQTGAFNVKSGSRYLYNANSTLDSGDNNENGKVGYAWHITEVEYLPIPGSGEAYSTICLPVDVNRDYRGSMVVLTPEIKNGKVVLTPMTDHVLPANTPYVLYNNGETQDGNLIYLHIVGCHDDAVASVTAAKAEGVNYISLNGNKFSALEGDVVPGFQYVPQVETAQDHAFGYNLVTPGKVYTIKNTDTGNNRGYLMHKADEDRMWTSGKFGLSNDAADEAAPANADYHWTLVEDNDGNMYLYNLGAKQFAGAYGKLNSAIAEFYWHFSEVPTAFSVDFLDTTPTFDLAQAQLNVMAGANTVKAETRPAGMTVVNSNPIAPVACSNNGQDSDGCTYFFTEVAGAGLPDDLPTAADIEAVKTTMHANHAAAVENIGNWNEDDAANHVGYFTAEGFSAFSNAINSADENATAEAKHYAYVRAKIASEGKVLEFVDGNVYNVRNADGEYYYAVATKQDSGFYETSVATAANLDSENVDFNWLAAVGEDGTVTLSHSFMVYQPVEAPVSRAAATTVKSTITHNLVEAVAPAHDGFGNSTLGQNLVVTAVNRDDKPETTAIEEISLDERAGTDVIYDLQGRRVSRAAKGVYIINGKKTLVK